MSTPPFLSTDEHAALSDQIVDKLFDRLRDEKTVEEVITIWSKHIEKHMDRHIGRAVRRSLYVLIVAVGGALAYHFKVWPFQK
ncbi:MAG: hypothetical protein E6Q97_24595 [Desulfurellales bacterium]|nr:MAG: hypothetical protein E6Q97_24595 [Desulfurellales bacterium]